MDAAKLNNCKDAKGFTLIELLVTISIIGILAALLLPVLGKAKERARRIQCLSNIRQIGTALQIYADQYHQHLPDCTTNNPPFFGSWWPWDLNTNLVTELESVGARRNILYCPSNAAMNDDQHWNFWKYHPPDPIRVVGYVFLLKGGMMIPPNLQRTSALGDGGKALSDTELVVDAVASSDGDYTQIRGKVMDRTSHLERSRPAGGNIIFADGHAAWRQFANMQHRIPVDVGVVWDF